MTNQQHPITPPPELVSKWANMFEFHSDAEVFSEVAQWGADMELEACCEWLEDNPNGWVAFSATEFAAKLRDARRPKPPSLKEQALRRLDYVTALFNDDKDIIRRALEQLDD